MEAIPAHEAKRIIEVWTSGLYDKQTMLADPAGVFARHGVTPHPTLLSALSEGAVLESIPGMEEYQRHMDEKTAWRDLIREESAPADPRMRQWRERQMKRCSLELGEQQDKQITYVPAAFELARGCSVNCWFCALDAPPLTALFRRTPENTELWRGVQEALRDAVGGAARWGSAYWATEPMDNPDYEAFCRDFHEIHGMFPQTTTAVPIRNPERTLAVVNASRSAGCLINRFSVHSAEIFKRVHELFSASDLSHTELILENSEASSPMARAGRLFDVATKQPELAKLEDERLVNAIVQRSPELAHLRDRAFVNTSHLNEEYPDESDRPWFRLNLAGTTACVAGFLVNMVDRTIKLISPCAADAEWPLGYIVHAAGQFDSVSDFKNEIERIMREAMPGDVLPETEVALSNRVNFKTMDDGFALSTVYARVSYSKPEAGAYLAHLGKTLRHGRQRAGEIAIECFYLFGQSEATTLAYLNDMQKRGLLAETFGRATTVVKGA